MRLLSNSTIKNAVSDDGASSGDQTPEYRSQLVFCRQLRSHIMRDAINAMSGNCAHRLTRSIPVISARNVSANNRRDALSPIFARRASWPTILGLTLKPSGTTAILCFAMFFDRFDRIILSERSPPIRRFWTRGLRLRRIFFGDFACFAFAERFLHNGGHAFLISC